MALGLLFLTSAAGADKDTSDRALAKDAYIYAYSIDEAYKFFYRTVVEKDYSLNRLQNIRHIADDSSTDHVTINNDMHLMGWLDIAAEPVIVSISDMDKGRYGILHIIDMGHYTNNMFGSRTREAKGGHFMFASQDWQRAIFSLQQGKISPLMLQNI